MKADVFQADFVFEITKSWKVDADTLKVRCVDKANSIKKFGYTSGLPREVKAIMAIE
jgi:hypothetical protein